jgi:UV DNA damage endonuclease
MSTPPRIGFCCKFVPPDGDAAVARAMNVRSVTMAFLSRQSPAAAFDKLSSVVDHNLQAINLQIGHVAKRPLIERMLRLTSDILPGYTHPSCQEFYRDADLRNLIESGLAKAGEHARGSRIRLSFHPGQFCVIASESESALRNGVAEFEYHADLMTLLGYGIGWHPDGAHINIHAGARAVGVEGFRAGLGRLSETARNLITVENDEASYGLDALLALTDDLPIVLDLHHHWIASGGEYVEPDDPRVLRIIESWRGVRPVSHVSVSREDLLEGHDPADRPDFRALVAAGIKPRDLRAHSDLMWNKSVNELVAEHLIWTDFEIEAKLKNLASEGLVQELGRFSS